MRLADSMTPEAATVETEAPTIPQEGIKIILSRKLTNRANPGE